MLNKKYLFGGYLVNIIAIFVSTSSDVIARESIHDRESIYDFRSELNQIYWDRACSFRESVIPHLDNHNEHSWILNDYYKNSRTKVIGKAICDCVADKGEFKGKKADDIITFENTLPELYERKNWNAVILYNYVHETINGNNLPEEPDKYCEYASDVKEVLKNKLVKIVKYYKKRRTLSLKKILEQAVADIQKYVNALKLNKSLHSFRESKLRYNEDRSMINLIPMANKSGSDKDRQLIKFHAPYYFATKQNPMTVNCYRIKLACYKHNLYVTGFSTWLERYKLTKIQDEQCYLSGNWERISEFKQYNTVNDDIKQYGSLVLDRLTKTFDFVKLPTKEQWQNLMYAYQ